jgi:hypothetical protein
MQFDINEWADNVITRQQWVGRPSYNSIAASGPTIVFPVTNGRPTLGQLDSNEWTN